MTGIVTESCPSPKGGLHKRGCASTMVEGSWLRLLVHKYAEPVALPSVAGSSGISAGQFSGREVRCVKCLECR